MSQQTALKIDIQCSCTIGHCQGMMAGPYWQRPILAKCTPAFPRTGAVWNGYKKVFRTNWWLRFQALVAKIHFALPSHHFWKHMQGNPASDASACDLSFRSREQLFTCLVRLTESHFQLSSPKIQNQFFQLVHFLF